MWRRHDFSHPLQCSRTDQKSLIEAAIWLDRRSRALGAYCPFPTSTVEEYLLVQALAGCRILLSGHLIVTGAGGHERFQVVTRFAIAPVRQAV